MYQQGPEDETSVTGDKEFEYHLKPAKITFSDPIVEGDELPPVDDLEGDELPPVDDPVPEADEEDQRSFAPKQDGEIYRSYRGFGRSRARIPEIFG